VSSLVNNAPPLPIADYSANVGSGLAPEKESFPSMIFGRVGNLEQFFADLPCLYYECDTNLNLTCISSNAIETVGFASQSLIGGKGFWNERVFAGDRAELISHLEEIAPGQKSSHVHRLLDECGLPIWVSHSFKKVSSKEGVVIRGCVVRLPVEIRSQSIDAKIIPQFVHKIGNHFQLINLLIGNLRRSDVPLREIENLQQSLDETVEFTRAFLYYYQVPSSQSEIELEEVLKTAIQSMLPSFAEKRVSFTNHVDDLFAGVSVRGDPSLLEVAFRRILENALDATKSNDRVSVNATCNRHPGGGALTANIVISDTGCGMDDKVLTQAADPFFTSNRGRDGLGLSLAVRIIEQHGGRVHLSSTEGRGTQVDVLLPASIFPQNFG
jgi:two-component sensor histidine kinase